MALRDFVTGSDACTPGDGAGPSNAAGALANTLLGRASKQQERLREVSTPPFSHACVTAQWTAKMSACNQPRLCGAAAGRAWAFRSWPLRICSSKGAYRRRYCESGRRRCTAPPPPYRVNPVRFASC